MWCLALDGKVLARGDVLVILVGDLEEAGHGGVEGREEEDEAWMSWLEAGRGMRCDIFSLGGGSVKEWNAG